MNVVALAGEIKFTCNPFPSTHQDLKMTWPTSGPQSVVSYVTNIDHQSVSKRPQRPKSRGSPPIIVAILLIFITIFEFSPVDASLIRIYHHYKPKLFGTTKEEPSQTIGDQMNRSSSFIEQQIASVEQPQTTGTEERATIEYTSPMNRIMDLIGHHAPIIVVNSDSNQEAEAAKTEPSSSQASAATGSSNVMNTNLQGQQQQQQHWTMLDTGQIIQQPPQQQQQQQQLAAQQQQLYQSSVPFEQFYTFTPSHIATDAAGNQITVLPSGGGFSPFAQQVVAAGGMQFVSPHMAGIQSQSSQNYQQTGSNNFQAQENPQAQPVFLSSYVPEIPFKPFNGITQLQPQLLSTSQQPNSIQQIQQQQQQQQPPQTTETEKTDKDPDDMAHVPGKDKTGDDGENEPEPQEKGKHDEEESTNRSKTAKEPDEGNGSSGSISYEDKYDSDKDEQPTQTTNSRKAEPSPAATSGLVNVGLNDDCLQCICRASSGCDHNLGCITRGAEEKFCGPFQLTEEYWNRAGSPGDAANNFHSFEECANDPDCAVETVTNYMFKYKRECDGDNVITCMDYARLHRLPVDECDNTEKLTSAGDAYWAKFQHCAEGYNKTRNGDDDDI